MLLNPKTASSTKTNSNSKTNTSTSDIAKAFPPSSYPGLSSDPFNVDLNSSTTPGNRNRNTSRGAIVPPGGNLRNVIGFKDIGGLGGCEGGGGGGNSGRAVSGVKTATPSSSDWGRGSSLTSSSAGARNTSISSSPEGEVDRKHLRDVWAKRFGGGNNSVWTWGDKRPNKDKPEGKLEYFVKYFR